MPLQPQFMPAATPYDPAADAAGSADPLGTLGGSERLAELILPGLTARMWRARLLTFAVVAADVADTVVRAQDDQEDLRLSARLAFERLFVSGLVRCEEDDRAHYGGVSRRVPGRRTARRALLLGDEPLTRRTFIKGQAINGPSGVMGRLARNLGLLDEAGQVAGRGHDLRAAWARAVAQEDDEDSSEFYRRLRGAVSDHLEGDWPRRSAPVWGLLVDALRPDRMPASERKLLAELLHHDPPHNIRPRVLDLLRHPRCLAVHERVSDADSRGLIERPVLLEGVVPNLGDSPVDAQLRLAIQAIDAYERFSALFAAVFDLTLWALRAGGGSAAADKLLRMGRVTNTLDRWRTLLAVVAAQIRDLLPRLTNSGPFDEQGIPTVLARAQEDAERATESAHACLDAILARHERVQREKRKPAWVDRSVAWTLMPGTPVLEEPPRDPPAAFVHPCRVVNAYSLMSDLQLVKGVRPNGENDGDQ